MAISKRGHRWQARLKVRDIRVSATFDTRQEAEAWEARKKVELFDLSSASLTPERLAQAVRGHWGIENSLHWVLDVVFREDQSRLRTGHGARNMAVVRHFAINSVRLAKGKRSIKTTRKLAGWDTRVLSSILTPSPR